jgi:hypothetical protein
MSMTATGGGTAAGFEGAVILRDSAFVVLEAKP